MQSVMSRFADTGIVLKNIGLLVWTHQRISPISHELIKARCRQRTRRSLAGTHSRLLCQLTVPYALWSNRLPWSCFSTALTIRSSSCRVPGPTRSAVGRRLACYWPVYWPNWLVTGDEPVSVLVTVSALPQPLPHPCLRWGLWWAACGGYNSGTWPRSWMSTGPSQPRRPGCCASS